MATLLAYLEPGSGSMTLQVVAVAVAAAAVAIAANWRRLRGQALRRGA
ncbi:MAG TPA: hypothetical protein VH300_04155 [Thermoleophilaceae bacterium]|jgi:hypothetical protein|nr:hypothetical protein [Thermoleophilaceae bacterium]